MDEYLQEICEIIYQINTMFPHRKHFMNHSLVAKFLHISLIYMLIYVCIETHIYDKVIDKQIYLLINNLRYCVLFGTGIEPLNK